MIYTKDCFQSKIEKLSKAIEDAAYIVIGAGAGLSTSAGYEYSGKRFEENFGDFAKKYGFRDMYSGGFYPFGTLEEYWAYWSRYIYLNRYIAPPKNVYEKLLALVKDKDYFVLTTNVDHCFQRAGFDKSRLFYTQGDFGLLQCPTPCHSKTYGNEELIKQMVKEQKDMEVPTDLIPLCPICKKPMTLNLRSDGTFVEDGGWKMAYKRWEEFISKSKDGKVLFLELGVGGNTPAIIKYPFWSYTMRNSDAVYACINYGEAVCPEQIEDRAICINEDIGKVIDGLLESK